MRGCTSFWNSYKNCPGFYDIKSSNIGNIPNWINKDPNHVVENWNGIQPGDFVLCRWPDSTSARSHASLVVEVSRDSSGNVNSITTLDGNWNGRGDYSYNNSKVVKNTWKLNNGYYDIRKIVSFVSVSTAVAEAQKGNLWK